MSAKIWITHTVSGAYQSDFFAANHVLRKKLGHLIFDNRIQGIQKDYSLSAELLPEPINCQFPKLSNTNEKGEKLKPIRIYGTSRLKYKIRTPAIHSVSACIGFKAVQSDTFSDWAKQLSQIGVCETMLPIETFNLSDLCKYYSEIEIFDGKHRIFESEETNSATLQLGDCASKRLRQINYALKSNSQKGPRIGTFSTFLVFKKSEKTDSHLNCNVIKLPSAPSGTNISDDRFLSFWVEFNEEEVEQEPIDSTLISIAESINSHMALFYDLKLRVSKLAMVVSESETDQQEISREASKAKTWLLKIEPTWNLYGYANAGASIHDRIVNRLKLAENWDLHLRRLERLLRLIHPET